MNTRKSLLIMSICVTLAGPCSVPAWGQALYPLGGTKGSEAINQGIYSLNQQRWDTAVTHFQKALRENPQSAEAHFNMALTLNQMGQHQKAAEHFKKASEFGQMNSFIQNSPILQQYVDQPIPTR